MATMNEPNKTIPVSEIYNAFQPLQTLNAAELPLMSSLAVSRTLKAMQSEIQLIQEKRSEHRAHFAKTDSDNVPYYHVDADSFRQYKAQQKIKAWEDETDLDGKEKEEVRQTKIEEFKAEISDDDIPAETTAKDKPYATDREVIADDKVEGFNKEIESLLQQKVNVVYTIPGDEMEATIKALKKHLKQERNMDFESDSGTAISGDVMVGIEVVFP